MKNKYIAYFLPIAAFFSACSSTKSIPEGDQLFTGVEKIDYVTDNKDSHFASTKEEVDAALATAPNGAIFGSGIRSPFPIGLWVWNEFTGKDDGFSKWMLKSFGSNPVLMSWVNPALRAKVAKLVLQAHGYFRGNVSYEVLKQKNPKEAKIKYDVSPGHLFTIDSLRYDGFPADADSLLTSTATEAKIHDGDAFDVTSLDGERTRISNLFRSNGYFYYQPSYASYLADTVSVPGKALLRFQQAKNIPDMAQRKWFIGKVNIDMRKKYSDTLKDSVSYRNLIIHYNGKKPPVRTGTVLKDMRIMPKNKYNYLNHQESANKLAATGMFSLVDFNFTPRDTTGLSDTLDLHLNLLFDKPYDFYVQGNITGKTNNRVGPGVTIGLTKRNAFRGGELLDINLKGSYEWQTGHKAQGTGSKLNSYEYGIDASLTFPRLIMPWVSSVRKRLIEKARRTRYIPQLTTKLKFSSDIIRRSSFFTRHVVSGEWTYEVQTSARSRHQFSPLSFSYDYMRRSSAEFDSVLNANPYLSYTMRNQFIPRMQYVYTYTSPSTYINPLWWQTTVSESGNILSLGYLAAGKKWGEKNKTMFRNPYAQFFKVETELVKTWRLSTHSTLVGHVDAGIVWSYGNSEDAPYSEQFYVGGANSIRAFTVRTIGPGSYHDAASAGVYYLDQTGDIKFLANLEYRPRLFGNLYGALFLDAGNVWKMKNDYREGGKFKIKNALQEMALGTGAGLRYDMGFLVIRLDWGVGLHVPYRNGFYNVGKFKDSQSLHFAVGYPF